MDCFGFSEELNVTLKLIDLASGGVTTHKS